jgi:Flp pilus assembly protein TadD
MTPQIPKLDSETVHRLRRFARGELTWAEVEGWTWEDAKAIAKVGCDLAADGRLNEALVIFQGMVAINPRDAGAHAALGTVFQKLDDKAKALAAYEAALAVDPRNVVALANRGELRLRAGEAAGADDLLAALEADPGHQVPATRRALAIVQAMALVASNGELAARA